MGTALAGATLTGLAAPAAASGSIVTSEGSTLAVVQQNVLLSWSEGQERMLLDVAVAGQMQAGGGSLLLMATPTKPEILLGDPLALEAVTAAAAPDVVIENRWWPDLDSFGGTSEDTDVSDRELGMGPKGARLLGASSADDLIGRLTDEGYEIDDRTVDAIRRYAEAGWTFSDLVFEPGTGAVEGRVPLLELRFATEEPVLPLLLNVGGGRPFQLNTYFLGPERWDRTDTMRGTAQITYSGPITAVGEPGLTDWLAPYSGTAVLTAVTQDINTPSRISEDVVFTPSTYGPVDAGTTVKVVDKIIFGLPAGLVLVAAGMLVIAIGGVTVSQLLQRRARG